MSRWADVGIHYVVASGDADLACRITHIPKRCSNEAGDVERVESAWLLELGAIARSHV